MVYPLSHLNTPVYQGSGNFNCRHIDLGDFEYEAHIQVSTPLVDDLPSSSKHSRQTKSDTLFTVIFNNIVSIY
jgi:hypothetical protein